MTLQPRPEPRRNWSGNVTYRADELVRPDSLDALRRIVSSRPKVTALGSRHSFSRIADTRGTQVSLAAMPGRVEIDSARKVARVPAGMIYSQLAAELDAQGLAVANLASLPHISVGGATSTGTHGSGAGNASLASSIDGLRVVRSTGEVEHLGPGHPDLDAHRVALGALGVLVELDLRVEPRFDIAQRVHLDLPWDAAIENFDRIMADGYSVSMFTRFQSDGIRQIWRKSRTDGPDPTVDLEAVGAVRATSTVHPVPGQDVRAVTPQLGVPGAWHERLPHFLPSFTPSAGSEIQCEYLLPREHAVVAIGALRDIGTAFDPVLMASEIRCVAADSAWLAPSSGRESVALHFTFARDEAAVAALLPRIDAALMPLGGRPHWGKVTSAETDRIAASYPRFDEFSALADRLDPRRVFRNEYLDRLL